MSAAATTRSSWTASRALLLPLAPRPVPAGSDPAPFSMPLGFTSGRPFTPLSVATSAFSPATARFRASFSASSRSARPPAHRAAGSKGGSSREPTCPEKVGSAPAPPTREVEHPRGLPGRPFVPGESATAEGGERDEALVVAAAQPQRLRGARLVWIAVQGVGGRLAGLRLARDPRLL